MDLKISENIKNTNIKYYADAKKTNYTIKKDVKEMLAKKAELLSHKDADKKDNKNISKAEVEKKNKTRENMLAKLKLKKR